MEKNIFHSKKACRIFLSLFVIVIFVTAYLYAQGCEFIHIKDNAELSVGLVLYSLAWGLMSSFYIVGSIWLVCSTIGNTIVHNTLKKKK